MLLFRMILFDHIVFWNIQNYIKEKKDMYLYISLYKQFAAWGRFYCFQPKACDEI